jgi:calcineurin-like phosphoesterase family protein
VKKHDEWLINLWNETVRREDVVYILGDFCLGNKEYTEKVLNRLKGKKFLIEGNHDKSLHGLERYFEWYGQIKEAKFTNNQYDFIDPNETFCVELCHYPLLTWNRRTHGSCMVHGHCHGSISEYNKQSGELRLDVGLDTDIANRGLVPLETVYEYFKKIKLDANCATFEEYNQKLMEKLGYRA